MPFVYGGLYPEVQSVGFASREFTIFIDSAYCSVENLEQLKALFVLKQYLNDIRGQSLRLNLRVMHNTIPRHLQDYPVETISTLDWKSIDRTQLNSAVKLLNCDIILSDRQEALRQKDEQDEQFPPILNIKETLRECETFMNGHDVPWSFDQPVWYMPLQNFYTMAPKVGQDSFALYTTRVQKLAWDNLTKERTRSLLLNRLSHVHHTREKIRFFVQQRRIAKQKNYERQAFIFECGYYLTNYYLSMWGGIDQLSLIVDGALNLNTRNLLEVSLAKASYRKRILEKHSGLGKLLQDNQVQDWLLKLKEHRDHSAHRGTIEITSLYRSPESEPTLDELKEELRRDPEIAELLRELPPEVATMHEATLIEKLRLSKYELHSHEVSIRYDRDKKVLFYPLKVVDWEYANFTDLIFKCLNELTRTA